MFQNIGQKYTPDRIKSVHKLIFFSSVRGAYPVVSQGVQGVQSAPPEKKLTGKIGKAKGKSGRQRKERKGKEKTKRKAKGIWKGKEKKEKGRHANNLENCIFLRRHCQWGRNGKWHI